VSPEPRHGLIAPHALTHAMARAIRLHTAVQKAQTIDELAGDAGLDSARLYKLMTGEKRWRGDELLSVLAVMGPQAATIGALRLAGLSASAVGEAANGVSLPARGAEVVRAVAVMLAAAADGRVDHTEKPQCEAARANIEEHLPHLSGDAVP